MLLMSSTNLCVYDTYIHPNFFQYEDKEEVVLWMNTVGPYHNRQETYAYYSLPFCQGVLSITDFKISFND